MTGWVRTGGGKAIHRPDCHIVKRSMRVSTWPWADDVATDLELLAKLGTNWDRTWNHFCYFCAHTGWSEQKRIYQSDPWHRRTARA